MTTTTAFKKLIDLPEWYPCCPSPNALTVGQGIACDLRKGEDRGVRAWQLVSSTVVNDYNTINDGWSLSFSPALAGTAALTAGACCGIMPSRGPRGTIAGGASPTSVTLSTALPGAVGVNTLANRGDGRGYKIRIIGNSAGSSGKTEERIIVGNSGGTTPTIYLDNALSFTPAAGDAYEILSGKLLLLGGGTVASGIWKAVDIATLTVEAALSTTNLPATISTDSSLLIMDESYGPFTPGEGFLQGVGDGGVDGKALTATGIGATSLTGQTASGDFGLVANEYRNFQIRIVKDTAIPTAVGQRRKITSHTGGAIAPVYTVPAWTVTPSPNAQYVIENANEVLLWTSASTSTFTYCYDAIGAASANTWSTATYAVRPAAHAAGCMSFQPWGMTLDPGKNARYSHIYSWRGGGVSTLDLFDIAGGATGLWSAAIVYAGAVTVTTGSTGCYEPYTNRFYFNKDGGNSQFRFDGRDRYCENYAQLRFTQGTAVVGQRVMTQAFVDGATSIPFVYLMATSRAELFRLIPPY